MPARSRRVEWRPSHADDEVGADIERPVRRRRAHAGHAAAFLDQIGRFGLHAQMKARIALAVRGEEVEEVPLRHQRDELAARRQMAEVHEGELLAPNAPPSVRASGVRQLEEFVEQAELVPSSRASRDGSCRRENRAGSRRASPAPRHRRRRARAGSRASSRPARRRRCSSGSAWSHSDEPLARHVAGEQRDAEQQDQRRPPRPRCRAARASRSRCASRRAAPRMRWR